MELKFLSTLSLRRATVKVCADLIQQRKFLSTLSLRRATRLPGGQSLPSPISIHALLAESDDLQVHRAALVIIFLSTLSLRRATGFPAGNLCPVRFLSTLSLRRATAGCSHPCRYNGNFYPRSPCGERQQADKKLQNDIDISIHALLAESDCPGT